MLTLKQLADKISKEYSLNISKQAIQYHGDKLEVEYHYINGIKHLDEGQQKLITDRIKSVHQINVDTSNESSNDNKNTTTNTNVGDDKNDTSDKDDNVTNVINVLIKQLNSKDDQLNAKDTQIDSLHEQLTTKSKLLENEQSLRLEQINDSKKVAQLENELEQYRLADNRRITNSNSSNVDNRSIKVKKYKVYSPTDESTNEDVKEDNVKYNKRTWLDKLLGLNK